MACLYIIGNKYIRLIYFVHSRNKILVTACTGIRLNMDEVDKSDKTATLINPFI